MKRRACVQRSWLDWGGLSQWLFLSSIATRTFCSLLDTYLHSLGFFILSSSLRRLVSISACHMRYSTLHTSCMYSTQARLVLLRRNLANVSARRKELLRPFFVEAPHERNTRVERKRNLKQVMKKIMKMHISSYSCAHCMRTRRPDIL